MKMKKTPTEKRNQIEAADTELWAKLHLKEIPTRSLWNMALTSLRKYGCDRCLKGANEIAAAYQHKRRNSS
jgi:hypothetical protein